MFKWKQLYSFFVPTLGIVSVGGSGGSSSSQQVLTPEQSELLKYQTQQLKDVFMPAYKNTVSGAKAQYETVAPYMALAAKENFGNIGSVSRNALSGGAGLLEQGAGGLGSLFDKNYETGQVQAALQTGREAARESQAGQNAMYGAAGGLGSARMALADRNLKSLNEQRMATAAANAQAQVQANKAAAAQSLMGTGGSLLQTGLSAAGQQLNMANAPLDLYSKYASIVYGVPQQSTNPNFANTQGTNTSGSSSKWGFGIG